MHLRHTIANFLFIIRFVAVRIADVSLYGRTVCPLSPQQVLLIRYSKGGEMLGAASVQVAFNLGNAIGAYSGGLALQAGLGYQYPALIGVPFAFAGFILLTVFHKKYEN